MSKRSLSMLIAVVLLVSLFSAASPMLSSSDGDTIIDMHVESHEGSSPQYVDEVRLEVRTDREEGITDTVTGDLDAFLQAIEGWRYDGMSDEWLSQLRKLNSYGSYMELTFNSAWTEDSGVEVDIDGYGNLRFNPFSIREVRYAANWLLNRSKIVEEINDGDAIPRYQALNYLNPLCNHEMSSIKEKHGLTSDGDFDKAYDMIQDAMTDAMNNPDLAGELRPPDESTTDFWQYRPPDGEWWDVEIEGLIRIEFYDGIIGLWFSDLLEECHIKVDRNVGGHRHINTWLFTDPADFQWGFYTGGWIESTSAAYLHGVPVQMYTDWWGYMPGGIIGEDARYYHRRDSKDYDAKGLVEDYARPLMEGLIEEEDEYWDAVRHISDTGVNQSMSVFVTTSREYIPLNRDHVTSLATDVTSGWSQVFSPRTIKTVDGTFTAGQFTAGELYMDHFNNIGGSSDYYGLLQQKMSKDYGTTTNPITGVAIGMRAQYLADDDTADIFNERYGHDISPGEMMLQTDYEFDEDGNLVTELELPDNDDTWWYCVQEEEWLQGGHELVPVHEDGEQVGADVVERSTVATAVTYNYALGKWHTGHDLTVRDILAYSAFSKQLAFGEEWGALGDQHYDGPWGTETRTGHHNTVAIEIVDAEEGIITFWGDYTFPAKSEICGYYATMPLHPWHLYEAVTHLRGETEYARPGAADHDVYEWRDLAGSNQVHWISSSQTIDFKNTLEALKDNEVVPAYISGPIEADWSELEAEIDAIMDWQEEYELSWISQGPFMITRYDTANMIVEMERFGPDDGYPFALDHWRDILYIGRIRHGTMTAPTDIEQGEALEANIRARVFEEYPTRQTRNLRADDDYVSTFTVYDGDEVLWQTDDPEYINTDGSYLSVNIPGHVTRGWEDGVYDIEFESILAGQLRPAITTRTLFVDPVDYELEEHSLSVTPTSGPEPLEITIEVSAENPGTTAASEDVFVDGEVVGTLTVPAGESASDTFTHNLDAGDYTVYFGPESQVVNVAEEPLPEGLENWELDVDPESGDAPLDVDITIGVENVGDTDETARLFIDEVPQEFTIPAGETWEDTISHTFDDAGHYLIRWGDQTFTVEVTEDEVEAELTDFTLDVDPTSGEEPLEVTISVSARNVGGMDGSVDVIIDGSVEYTLNVPAGETAEHEFDHVFDEHGDYVIDFGDQSVTVEVEEEDTPGFMFLLLAVSAVFAVVIYHTKKR